jgi:hypothetical protein
MFSSHKNKTPQPVSDKKSKSRSSTDQIEKEGADAEVASTLPTSSSNKSNEFGTSSCHSDDSSTTPICERTLISSTSKQSSPTPSPKNSAQVVNTQEKENETHDSDDELTDHAVNLVVLGEVAGKKFSEFFILITLLIIVKIIGEMSKSSTQPEQVSRKRFPTPELKSVMEDEPEHSRLHKNVKEVGKCLSTENEPASRILERKALKIDTHLQRAKHPHTIVKSMSDILSNRTHFCADEPSVAIAPIDEDLSESPDSGLILDANQATVGSGQGQWAKDAKDILSGTKVSPEAAPKVQEKESDKNAMTITKPKPQTQQRPLLATIFSQNNESSETKSVETPSESNVDPSQSSEQPTTGQISSQNSKDEENSGNNSTRRSRFPYRFKHHTVNLLTG